MIMDYDIDSEYESTEQKPVIATFSTTKPIWRGLGLNWFPLVKCQRLTAWTHGTVYRSGWGRVFEV